MPLCLDKVLITGGAGFIGSHLVDRMLQEGFEVIVVDDLSTGKWKNIEHHESNANFHFVKQSILNFKSIKRIVADVDAVLHQAAIASVTESMEDPFSTNLTNVTGTLNLLKASIDTHVKRFVFASSSSVYGDSKSPSQHEAMPVAPMSPYAASKTCGEAYCQVYHRIYGLNTTSLRYFNVYGPRQSYGPYSGVITIFIDRILKGQPPIIFGTGKQSRDFIHVTDVAEANLLAMRSKNATGEIINIGSGKSATINELAKMLLEITGRNYLKPRHTSPRLGDVKDSCADTRKAKRILGFSPRTRLREGLARLIESLSRGR